MDPLRQAEHEIRRAEAALRSLAAEAAAAGRYDETIRVTRLAAALAGLTSADPASADEGDGDAASVPGRAAANGRRRAVPKAASPRTGLGIAQKPKTKTDTATPAPLPYPRFRREGDELVKAGWSRSERREYEHRAPKAAVDAVARGLSRLAIKAQPVATADLIPVITPAGGDEVPVYQVYVALAWMRGAGLIEADGRRGHRCADAARLPERVAALWLETASA